MEIKDTKIQYADSIRINGEDVAVWPEGQDKKVNAISQEPTVLHTVFEDTEKYHARLIERILELEKDEDFTHRMIIGGGKVRHVHEWGIPEADLINARAINFFERAVGAKDAIIQLSWASVSRKGEYLSVHSHDHCLASMVYMLTPGNPNPDLFVDGKLALTDPRLPACCDQQEGRVTNEVYPDMVEGAMVMFPSEIMHHVHPYTGDEPRISIAWNFNLPT